MHTYVKRYKKERKSERFYFTESLQSGKSGNSQFTSFLRRGNRGFYIDALLYRRTEISRLREEK